MNSPLRAGWSSPSAFLPSTFCLPTSLFTALIVTVSLIIISTPRASFAQNALTDASARSENGEDHAKIEEIVVTAEKKQEYLLDVPVPASVIKADTLVNSNQMTLQDYYAKIPGLSLLANPTGPIIAIRGITTGGLATNPTVGITVDDVLFGHSSNAGGGAGAADIDPSDLQRVEVLRGPQGTLYGASSIGGLIKYVTIDPSTQEFSGRLQAGTLDIKHGDGLGYSVRGSVNVPVSDTLAIRMSGYDRHEPGYIDNPVLGINGVNRSRVDGGRLAALWRPSDTFSLKLSALIQSTETSGGTYTYPALGSFREGDLIPDGGKFDRKLQAYSATLTSSLGPAELTAITGYSVDKLDQVTALFSTLGDAINALKTDKFTQEVRLTMPVGAHLDWLVGAFYTNEKTSAFQSLQTEHANTFTTDTLYYASVFPNTVDEYAAFTDLTFKVNDRFDVQIGGRESFNRQTYNEHDIGLFFPGGIIAQQVDTRDNSFTYLLTPRFKITPDLMVYSRTATGYRVGGPNSCSALPGVPCHFAPDKTTNYEVGLKASTPEHVLSVDASLYYIAWHDIQLQLFDKNTGFVYNINGGQAKSQGVELSAEWRPFSRTTVAGWVAWNDAQLTRDIPKGSLAYGLKGDRLPYSSPFSGSLSLDQHFPLRDTLSGFVGATVSHVGRRETDFTPDATTPRATSARYTQTDLRLGVMVGSWTGNLFANNVSNACGILAGINFQSGTVTCIQPRTIGLSVTKTFE